jgi:pimeloyl-ACP methyl ester carboxylesterase
MLVAAMLAALCLTAGCSLMPAAGRTSCPRDVASRLPPSENPNVAFPERLDRGYTIVLPGIWGDQTVDYGIVTGLKNADVQSAIELYDWTASPMLLVYNLRALDHNRAEARKIADKIVAYQQQYPGRPVHLIGYSGGGGVAALVLEALPPDHRIATAILLAPTLACDYDLRLAISRTEHGIHNFYSPLDAPILMVLGTVVGTTEGRHTLPAGAVGFETPPAVAANQRDAYKAAVVQISYDPAMLLDGHTGGHLGWANATFVAHHVAPLLAPPAAPLTPPADDAATPDRLARRW